MTAAVDIAANLAAVRARIAGAAARAGRDPAGIALVAVSKNQPDDAIRAAFAAGQREFGENRVQELVHKAAALADLPGLRWHMVGSLQTNKVEDLLRVRGLALVHSLDRPRLADALQQALAATGRTLPVLLQAHVTDEVTKHGCAPADAALLVRHVALHCPLLLVAGVMAMGPAQGDPAPAFARAIALRDELHHALAALPRARAPELATVSLGMSGDLEAAVAAGSTLVRIGTDVFGPRPGREAAPRAT